ncbi:hypothetical protein E4U54_002366 [Claviceps lovelessii]|nr:hypothetical protein E4U54_002366 [Claviceps lovelessii]
MPVSIVVAYLEPIYNSTMGYVMFIGCMGQTCDFVSQVTNIKNHGPRSRLFNIHIINNIHIILSDNSTNTLKTMDAVRTDVSTQMLRQLDDMKGIMMQVRHDATAQLKALAAQTQELAALREEVRKLRGKSSTLFQPSADM